MSIGPLQPAFMHTCTGRKINLNEFFRNFLYDIQKTKLYENLLEALRGEILIDKGWREILEHLYRNEHEFMRQAYLINIQFEDTPDFYKCVLHKGMGGYTLWYMVYTLAELGFNELAEAILRETGNESSIQKLPGKISHRYSIKPHSERE